VATIDDVQALFLRILQRDASDADAAAFTSVIDSGALTLTQVRDTLVNSAEADLNVDPVIRLYQAAFGRVPDLGGFDVQVDALRAGGSVLALAEAFAGSQEFINRFGSNTVTDAFVEALYVNVLGRASDPAGKASFLASGKTAGEILFDFAQSPEFVASSQAAIVTFLQEAGDGTQDFTGSLGGPNTGTPGDTFVLTDKADNVAGTANNDTIKGVNGSTDTLTNADVIDGGAGTDTLEVILDDNASVASLAGVSNVEVFSFRELANGTIVDLGTVTGETNVVNDRSTGALTFNNLATGTTVTVKGDGNTNIGTTTFSNSTASDPVAIALEGGVTTGGAVNNTSNAAKSATITSTGAANTVASVQLSAAATVETAKITATTDVTTGNITGFKADAKITVDGAGKANIGTLEAAVKEVDASGNSGGVTVVLGQAADIFTGGSGNDTVTLAAGPTAAVNGGAGTGDRLIVTDDTFIDTTKEQGQISNFEILRAQEAGAFVVDISKIAGATKVEANGTTSLTVTGISSQALDVIGDNVGNLIFTKTGLNPGGTDALTVSLDNSVGKFANGVDAGTLAVLNVDNLTLNSVGGNLGAGQTNSVNGLVNADLEIVTVTGDTALDITTGASSLDTVDASAFTGALTLNAAAGGQVNVTGGSGADTLTGSANNDVINGGAGKDTITGGDGEDKLTGGADADTFQFAAGDLSAAPSATIFDEITDFAKGEDIIDDTGAAIVFLTNAGAPAVGTAEINAEGIATFNVADDTLAERIVAAEAGINAGGAAAAGQSAIFEQGGDSYLFISDGVDGIGAADNLIKLTGVTGLTDSTLTAGDLTIA